MRGNDIYKSFVRIESMQTELISLRSESFDIITDSQYAQFEASIKCLIALSLSLHELYEKMKKEDLS
jgi:hypothetical protein